jgi:ABC-type transport system involved in multi-copper enzyme maturation permease subunit
MTTTQTLEPPQDVMEHHTDAVARAIGELRVTQAAVVRSEWSKFRSVRSNLVSLGSAAAAFVLLGMLFASLGDADRGPRGTATDSLAIIFGGLTLSQLILGVATTVFVTSEYSSGMIRTMFAAVGRRPRVLWAKAGVAAAATAVTMTAAAFVTFFAGGAVFGGGMPTYSLGDPGVLRAIVGAGVYATCVALIGVALGFVMRSTASAIGVMVTLFMVAPILLRLVPGSIGDWLGKIMPSSAGDALMSVSSPATLLSPGQGLMTLLAWVAGLLGIAWVLVQRRDA